MPLNKRPHKRPRIYADENVFPESVGFLRSKKINVLHAGSDLKFAGKDDTFHWEHANKSKRTLLTLDRDFLSNRLFPLRKSWGTIIVKVTIQTSNASGVITSETIDW